MKLSEKNLRLQAYRKIASGESEDIPFSQLLGMRLTDIDSGKARVELTVELPKLANPLGWLHGGAITSLADYAMGMSFLSKLSDDEVITTVELKMNLLKGSKQGDHLVAIAQVIKLGRTLGYSEVEIRNQHGDLIAKGSSTGMRLPAE
jgi:uncharacterized protein (TIGR00369 family)